MPSPTTGASSWLRLNPEKSGGWKGTAATANIDLAFVTSALKPAGEPFAADPSLGGMAPKDPLIKLKRGEGSLDFAMRYEGYDNLILALLGHYKKETLTLDVGTNTYERFYYPHSDLSTIIDPVPATTEAYRSFAGTLVVPDETQDGYDFSGLKINGCTFNFDNQGLRFLPNLVCGTLTKNGDASGTATPSFSTAPLVLGGAALNGLGGRVSIMDYADHDGFDDVGPPYDDDFTCIADGSISIDIPHKLDKECLGSFEMQEPQDSVRGRLH
jgi:hypothetical protein